MSTKPEKEFWSWWKLVLIVVTAWLLLGFGTFLVVPRLMARLGVNHIDQTGQFGDTFGAVNSLFSALGVAGVAYALILQYREQRDARDEARQTREHQEKLAMTSSAIAAYSAVMQYYIANHESTSQMIRNHPDKIDIRNFGDSLNEQVATLNRLRLELQRLARYADLKAGAETGEPPPAGP